MRSEDVRQVVMRMIDDGMSSVEIFKELRNVVSQRTVRRW
jgi:type II secretory ATPase GspE/PulE/Tfp pilus assembly ATPase PilB-like protein